MTVVEVEARGAIAYLRAVLRDLPEWFGIEEATAAYIGTSRTSDLRVDEDAFSR